MIVNNPQYSPTSAYQPITYRVFATASLGLEIPYTRFTVYVNGVAIATDKKAYYATAPSFGNTEYYFEVDIQEYLQRFLAPNREKSSMFGELGAATQVQNTDAYVEIYVQFQYLVRNLSTNKIITSPLVDTSGTSYVCIAKRLNGQDRSLDEFIGFPSINSGFLTNRPRNISVCQLSNAFVSFLDRFNYIRVVTFNAVGGIISDEYAPTGNVPNMQGTVGTGIPQLEAITNWQSGNAPIFTGAASYSVTFGLGIPVGTTVIFVGNPNQFTYTIKPSCCDRKLRLFWLNDLGGVDHYEFSYVALQNEVSATNFQKPLGWVTGSATPHSQNDYGIALNNIEASTKYQIDTRVSNVEMRWLRELKWSAEVYIQNPSGANEYWRVWLTPGTFTEKAARGIVELSMEINLSQTIPTHRV